MSESVQEALNKPLIPVNRENKLTQTQNGPLIRLEELSNFSYRVVFLATYAALAIGSILLALEQYVKLKVLYRRGNFISEHQWEDDFSFTPIQLFFSIDLIVSRDAVAGYEFRREEFYPELNVPLNMSIELRGFPDHSSPTKDSDTLVDSNVQTDIYCPKDTFVCAPVQILLPQDYQYAYEKSAKTLKYFVINVGFDTYLIHSDGSFVYEHVRNNDVNNTESVDMTMEFELIYNRSEFRYLDIAFHGLFSLISVVVLVFWIQAITHAARTNEASKNTWAVVAEQKWVTILLLALFGFQGPFFVPWILKPCEAYLILSDAAFTSSIVVILIFALLIVDSIRENAQTMGPENNKFPPVHSFPWNYYFWKILLGLIMLLSYGLTAFIPSSFALSRSRNVNQTEISPFGKELGTDWKTLWIGSLIVASCSTLIWFAWLCFATVKAHSALENLPYLETRFRQLSFRFFIFQTSLVVVYTMVQLSIQLIDLLILRGEITTSFNSQNTSLGTFLLLSFYGYILVYIYWPASKKNRRQFVSVENLNPLSLKRSLSETRLFLQKEKTVVDPVEYFSFEAALVLLDFSYQIYEEPLNRSNSVSDSKVESQASVEKNLIDEEKTALGVKSASEYGFEIVDEIRNISTDTKCVVYRRDHEIIISFRGTASLKNAQTNLWFSRSMYVLDYGGPSDTNSLSEQEKTFIEKMLKSISGGDGTIHGGFLNAYQAIQPQLLHILNMILRESFHKQPISLFITGHSLGGALSTVCAYDIASRFPGLRRHLTVYTFGSPRVGDHEFAHTYNSMIPKTYRIVCDRDVITRWPKFLFLYKHVGIEILIDRNGNHIFRPSIVEKQMRMSSRSINDHKLSSYRQGLDNCLEKYAL